MSRKETLQRTEEPVTKGKSAQQHLERSTWNQNSSPDGVSQRAGEERSLFACGPTTGLRTGAGGMCAVKKHKQQIKGVGLARACGRTAGARPEQNTESKESSWGRRRKTGIEQRNMGAYCQRKIARKNRRRHEEENGSSCWSKTKTTKKIDDENWEQTTQSNSDLSTIIKLNRTAQVKCKKQIFFIKIQHDYNHGGHRPPSLIWFMKRKF
jgi:hypothetical protein